MRIISLGLGGALVTQDLPELPMNTQSLHKKIMQSTFVVFLALMLAGSASAAVMGSANYSMQSDSVNVGGVYGTSTSYHMEDTVGEIATGNATSTSYNLHAGYQQMHESSISISTGSDINLTALSISQDTAVGNSSWTVTTDDPAGYSLSVEASTDPALQDSGTGEVFIDYSESTPGTPETWSVSGAYEFGFSVRGSDVPEGIWGTDTDCIAATNVPSAGLKWRGFDGTTDIEIASRTSRTTPSGVISNICVASEQEGVFAPSGTYTATITATALAQ
jgi:hypothetical protein